MGEKTQSIVQTAAALNFNFGNLKYSRDHESEADYMGLIFAAMAGYDPQVAISFWQRMASASTNQQSEFFSDHPSDETRIKNITAWMPEALKYYKGGGTTTTATTKATTKSTSTTPSTTKTLHISTKKK